MDRAMLVVFLICIMLTGLALAAFIASVIG